MGGGKGPNNAPPDSKMTQMAGPWQPLQRPLQDVIPDAQRLYQQGPSQFGPSAVAPWNAAQQQGFQQGMGTARSGQQQLDEAFDTASYFSGHGANQPGQDFLAWSANNPGANPADWAQQQTLQESYGPSAGIDQLNATARGDYLNGNKYLDSTISNTLRDVNETLLPQLEGRMSQTGRYDADLEAKGQGQIAKTLSETAGNMRSQAYEAERSRQVGAASGAAGAENARAGVQLGAAGQIGNDAYRNLQQQIGAAQASNQGALASDQFQLNAAGQVPQQFQGRMAASDEMMRLGGMQQQQTEAQLQENQARFQYGQNAPWDNLNRYIQTLSGVGGMTNPQIAGQYAAQQMSGPSAGQQMFGNAMALAGLGTTAYTRSDRRLKKDIERIGRTDKNVPLYRYRYKWEEPDAPWRVGVLAQELGLTQPDAVREIGGYLSVDYGKVR